MGGFAYFPGTAPAPWTGDLYGFSYIGGSGGGGGGSFAGWTRKAPLVIQHLQVTADQTALPVLITAACLPAEMVTLGGANAAQSDGGDIRFSSDAAGASQLACEVVAWTQNVNPALAVAEIWVPVNVLAAANVTIYVWYAKSLSISQPGAAMPFGAQAVWDSNYVAVHHWGNGTTLDITDSTSYINHLTNNDPAQTSAVAGKAGAGAISCISTATTRLYKNTPSNFPTGSAVFSIECWANNILHDTGIIGWGNWGSGAFTFYQASGNMNLTGDSSNGQKYAFADVSNWHHFMFTLPSGTTYANVLGYLDGALQTSTGAVGSVNALGTQWRVTGLPNLTSNSNIYQGLIDEVRVSKVARSATWISTSYNSQNSPSTFVIAGTPLSAP